MQLFLHFFSFFRKKSVTLHPNLFQLVMKSVHLLLFGCWIGLVACTSSPTTVERRRAERRVQDSISLLQFERSVAYSDSLLQKLLPQVDTLLASFVYEKRANYMDKGYYIPRSLTIGRHIQHCFLQPCIRDDGQVMVRSYYFGSRPIKHTSVRVTSGEVSSLFTGSLHLFQADGQYEIMTLDEEPSLSLLRCVDAFSDAKIVVTLEGNAKYKYVLPPSEAKAMISGYRLAVLIKDIQRLERETKQASLQVQKYKKRLQKSF